MDAGICTAKQQLIDMQKYVKLRQLPIGVR
jgi:hypothetical protein